MRLECQHVSTPRARVLVSRMCFQHTRISIHFAASCIATFICTAIRRGSAYNHCTVVSEIATILDLVAPISGHVPLLGPIATTAANIVGLLDNLHNLKESCSILAIRAAHLTYEIAQTLESVPPERVSPKMAVNITTLCENLQSIETFMHGCAKMSWFGRFWKRFTIQKDVLRYSSCLEDAFKQFQMQAILHLSEVLVGIDHVTVRMQDDIIRTGRVVTEIRKQVLRPVEDARIFRRGDVIASRSSKSTQFTFGRIEHAKLTDGALVLWKRYNRHDSRAMEEFEREKEAWKSLSHPYLVQFLGQSAPGSAIPSIVLTGCLDANLQDVVRVKLADNNICVSFLSGLDVLQGVASGLLYLAKEFQLEAQELENCAKVSNFLINPDGRPILGRNLVEHVPNPNGDTPHQHLDRLLELIYFITEDILFGNDRVFPYTSWSAVGEGRSLAHLRPLLRLVSWNPSLQFSDMVKRMCDLDFRLRQLKSPSFNLIRQELLDTQTLYHAMSIFPRQPWAVDLFDVGYVRQESFVFLCNARSMDGRDIPIEREAEFPTLPDLARNATSFPDGVFQYTFCNTNHASIQRRLNSQKADTVVATHLFQDILSRIYNEHRSCHQIRLSDLIIVTGIISLPSGAGIVWQDSCPEFFYFYLLPEKSQPWGYWSTDDLPTGATENIIGADIYSAMNPQQIDFIQFQEEEGMDLFSKDRR
ncbi:hypothetical protein BD410DRAFT_52906 [Rickenella mellea]|uniref:Serine-threonine/tyrosine-protein kinase catalytic domain-containing protein n=1 Tax=Rickenella mellea TaxID=50990 RepID=A0A4R5XIG7_9AGAM|nr:hypothetical protein BD410DRAFT_52906 [Rickenella mellea]